MLSMYFPRFNYKEPWSVSKTFYGPFVATKTRAPYDKRIIENPCPCVIRRSFKTPIIYGDYITPTTYGRVTFNCFEPGIAHQDYYVGYYRGVRPVYHSFGYLFGRTNYWSDSTSASGVRLYADINHENRLMAELVTRFVDSPIDIGNSLAEVDQTANYLVKQVNNLASGLIAIKTGSRRRGKKLLRDSRATLKRLIKSDNQSRVALFRKWFRNIPSSWKASGGAAKRYLEYKFALLPLAYDCMGAHELAYQGLAPDNRYKADAGQLSISHAVLINSKQEIVTGGWIDKIDALQVYYARIWASIDDPELFALARLGLVNPASVVWERVTLSWLVDYVLPIGTFLRALTSTLGLKFERGYKGLSLTALVSTSVQFAPQPRGSAARGVVTGFERNVLKSFPTVLPYVKSPFTINESQFGNIVALARIFFR
jgi:hypothetical protein